MTAKLCARLIAERYHRRSRVGIVLGSGLARLADAVEDVVAIPYADLPGFPAVGVTGHGGVLLLGRIGGIEVAMLSGRAHYYEHGRADVMRTAIETLALIGCEAVILTNAAGSLDPDLAPGELMLITDHINFAGINPLFGETTDRRFVGMTAAYDPDLARHMRDAAAEVGVRLAEGVYIWFSGPSFETPAEIRAARILGATAVGMSTVPEVILARYFGLKVAAVSAITNFAAGMTGDELTHQEVSASGPDGAAKLARILPVMLAGCASQTRA